MKKQFEIKPEKYGFPSTIGGLTIKTITWKDFPAKPPENTWFLAYTYWNTNYTFFKENGKDKIKGTVSIGPKAWTRAEDDFRLLEHQTGHYWIACLCLLELTKKVNYTQKKPDNLTFPQWCQVVFKKTQSQFCCQQKRYDKQTYHYCIEEEQERWKGEMVAKFVKYATFFKLKQKQQAEMQKKKEKSLAPTLLRGRTVPKVQKKSLGPLGQPPSLRKAQFTIRQQIKTINKL